MPGIGECAFLVLHRDDGSGHTSADHVRGFLGGAPDRTNCRVLLVEFTRDFAQEVIFELRRRSRLEVPSDPVGTISGLTLDGLVDDVANLKIDSRHVALLAFPKPGFHEEG